MKIKILKKKKNKENLLKHNIFMFGKSNHRVMCFRKSYSKFILSI